MGLLKLSNLEYDFKDKVVEIGMEFASTSLRNLLKVS